MDIAANGPSRAPVRTLAVIPARLGATRLPRKPLRLLGGAPLVVRVLERVQQLGLVTTCVVATDSHEVAQVVRDAGGHVEMTAAEHPSGTDRVAEVAARIGSGYAAIVNVQGDEPFVAQAAIAGALSQVCDHGFPLGTAAASAPVSVLANPNIVKAIAADDGRAMYFSRAPVPFLRDGADATTVQQLVLQHIGVYAYTAEALACWVALPQHPLEQVERLEQLRPLAAGLAMGIARIDGPLAGGIDTEEDLARANAMWPRHPMDTP